MHQSDFKMHETGVDSTRYGVDRNAQCELIVMHNDGSSALIDSDFVDSNALSELKGSYMLKTDN